MGSFDPNDKKYEKKEIKPGRYIALTNLVFPKQSKSGTDMVVVQFRVIGRDAKGAKTSYEYFMLTDEAGWKLARFAKACAEPGKTAKPFDPTSLKSLTKALHDKIVAIHVELRDDRDADGAKVKRPRVIQIEPITDEDNEELTELYGDEENWPCADDNIPPAPKDGGDSRKPKRRNDDDDDEDEKPRRRRDDDDDDEPAPKRKAKPADDDDEEPAPKPKRKPADDDDDDEPPKTSRRKKFHDDDDVPF